MPGIKFFRFPAEKQRRDKWVCAIRRHKWKPNEYSRVCSSHFISGSPSKDPLSPDYVPSVFSFTGKKSTNRYFSAKCRKIHPIKRSQLVKRRKQSQSLSAGAAAADTDDVQNESQSKSSDEVRINVEVMTDIEMITLPECLELEPQIPEDIPLLETATFALENESSQFEHPVEINTDSDIELENAKIDDDFCDAEMEVPDAEMEVPDLDYINDELTELECQIEDKEVEIGEMQIEMECLKNKYETLLEENLTNGQSVDPTIFEEMIQFYKGDINKDRLQAQLIALGTVESITNLQTTITFLKSLNETEKEYYSEVMKVAKLILVMPATNALSERSFSALYRTKTWLRSTINQVLLNHCMTLYVHKSETDSIVLEQVGNEFIQRNNSRIHIFGHYD